MAHAVKLNTLTEGLITSITDAEPDHVRFKAWKEFVVRGLRNQSHARTNQFEVRSKYGGLIEKFAVLNRDDLADALQERWDELPERPTRWQPEILSLLLLLSDRPVEKTPVDALIATHAVLDVADLTWEDIVAQEPFSDDELWQDVERGYHSSGDEAEREHELQLEPTVSTRAVSIEENLEANAEMQIVQPNKDAFVAEARDLALAATREHEQIEVSELFMIRETLAMLQGLPTTLFDYGAKSNDVGVRKHFRLSTASHQATYDALVHIEDIGSALKYLRQWCRGEWEVREDGKRLRYAFVETCQAGVQRILQQLSAKLSAIEQRHINPISENVVSIAQVRHEVQVLCGPIVDLSARVVRLGSNDSYGSPFALLDQLYTRAGEAQMSAANELFELCGSLLTDASRTYMRQVKQWVTEGRVIDSDGTLFVEEAAAGEWTLGDMWLQRFRLRTYLHSSKAYAPNFLQRNLARIFAMGKTRAFLRELPWRKDPTSPFDEENTRTFPTWDELQPLFERNPLLPFAEFFERNLLEWLNLHATDATEALKTSLLYDAGRSRLTDIISVVYHSRDGASFQAFADSLFERVALQSKGWRDAFLVTELAQDTLGDDGAVDPACISVLMDADGAIYRDLDSILRALETVTVKYAISWPLQNITHESYPSTDAKLLSFLLQTYRAKYLLRAPLLELRRPKTAEHQKTQLRSRQRLSWFVEIVHAHVTSTASILTDRLQTALDTADNVDAMAASYAEYKKRLEMALLLAPNLKPIRHAVTNVLELCEKAGNAEAATKSVSDFDSNVSFIIAGLHGISRAGGESALEVLAERLEWRGN